MEWELLLMRIQARRVIPVIGPDLVLVEPSAVDQADWEAPAGSMTVESYLAYRLAHEWSKSNKTPEIHPRDLPGHPKLNDFVCLYLDRGGSREGLDQFYGHVAALFARTKIITDPTAVIPAESIRLPETLVQLAEITDFNLFLTTAGDTLLERVIRKVRPGPEPTSPSPGFSNEYPMDLPAEAGTARAPIVYHLFGQFGVEARSFALTEDDLLDYIVSLQTRSPSLGRLSDALKSNQLLLLGGGFSDWLARFIMRTAKPRLLNAEEILADDVTDPSLRRFLQRFSPKTTILPGGGAAFVATLHEKWTDWMRQKKEGAVTSPSQEEPLAPVMPPKVAFISYAREDQKSAHLLRAALKAAGVEAWFDQEQLEAGDNWDAKIRLNVQRCGLFLPLISRKTEARIEGYFRREWKAAALRRDSIDDTVPFIFPLLVDHDLSKASVQRVPKEFLVAQWVQCLSDGGIPGSYVEKVKSAYELWNSDSLM